MSEEPEFGPDHNSHLSPESQRAILLIHVSRFQAAKAQLEEAKTEMGSVVATAKKTGFSKKDLELATTLLEDEDEKVSERREREALIARLIGRPFTAQLELELDGDKQNEAFEKGRIQALRGLPQLSPYSPASKDGQKWLEGFYAGVAERNRVMDLALNGPQIGDDTDVDSDNGTDVEGDEPEDQEEDELEEA